MYYNLNLTKNSLIIFLLLIALCLSSPAFAFNLNDLSDLTIEEKVGQLFFLAFQNIEIETSHYNLTDGNKELLKKIQPSGVVLFGENISDDKQLRLFIDDVKSCIKIPPFIALDQEGGRVQRIHYPMATTIPPMSSLGEDGSVKKAYTIGRVLARDIKKFGFNMDFAPVCDVFSNPANTVIGDRAFSNDSKIVSRLSQAVYNGINDEGVIPVIKHFPGHGDTVADTHKTSAYTNKTLDELRNCELAPFASQIKKGAKAVMVAHITANKLDSLPATLSHKIITELLREELGFNGVVITDALGMKAISDNYTIKDAVIMAINAGCDILLMPNDPAGAFTILLNAFKNGDLSLKRLNESVARIMLLKESLAY